MAASLERVRTRGIYALLIGRQTRPMRTPLPSLVQAMANQVPFSKVRGSPAVQALVLVVEDEPQMRRMLVSALASFGYRSLHVGLKGTMNALFLKDLAAKTHRGLRGRVEHGKSGGGLCYGYRVVKKAR